MDPKRKFRSYVAIWVIVGFGLIAVYDYLPALAAKTELYLPVIALCVAGVALVSRKFGPNYNRIYLSLLGVILFFSPTLVWTLASGSIPDSGKAAALGYLTLLLVMKLSGSILIIVGAWMSWLQFRQKPSKSQGSDHI